MTRSLDLDSELAAEVVRVELVLSHRTSELAVPRPPERSPIARAAERFGLDAFERWALTLAIAAELEPRVAQTLARRDDNFGAAWPTAGLALALAGTQSPRAGTSALHAEAPLRAWGLVELDGPGPLPARTLRLAPGVGALFARIADEPVAHIVTLDQLELAADLRERSTRAAVIVAAGGPGVVVIAGEAGSGRAALALAIAECAGAPGIVRSTAEHPDAIRFAVRDATLRGQIAIVEVVEQASLSRLAEIVRRLRRPLIVVGSAAMAPQLAELGVEPVLELATTPPDARARTRMWSAAVPAEARGEDLDLAAIASRFRLGPAQIGAAARLARSMRPAAGVSRDDVEAAARAVSLSKLGELAELLGADRTLDDLVLPAAARRELDLAIAWARHGTAVFAPGGAGATLGRGPGMACLFYGPSGTGKTLGARVLANAIGLALYRADLSRVMDKYIGETEKRLERLFCEAERGNAILFFDEADVLFAKRTEVNDARDRYANLETGYLLQRIERHPGICILATNLRDNFDPAFLRRIHVAVEFPIPRPAERAAIWRRMVPATHADDVDLDWLAQRFVMTGGEINNAIATSVLVATADARPLAMRDLVFGVWRELTKSGRLVEAGQFGPWASHVIELVKEARSTGA